MPLNAELLHKCRKGDPQAQFELYRQFYGLIRTICARYSASGQDLNALVNEAFFKILTGINMYQVHIPFEVWAKKVAVHVVIDDHRKQKKYRQFTVIKESMETPAADVIDWNGAEKKLQSEDLQQMLAELPDIYKRTFCLFVIDGFSHKEIAELLHIKEGTSKWYVSEARNLLKTKLKNRLQPNEYVNREFKDVR